MLSAGLVGEGLSSHGFFGSNGRCIKIDISTDIVDGLLYG
jgi:hypothetical protein